MEHPASRQAVAKLFPSLENTLLDVRFRALSQKLEQAASTNDLAKLIEEIDLETKALDAHLGSFIGTASRKHTLEIAAVELARAKLSGAIANSTKLTRVFTSANDLGHSLTSKIKALDEEIGNVGATLSFVSDVQTLRNNIGQIQYAIDNKNWVLAAQCIHTINHKLSPNLVNGKFASAVIPSTDIPELPGPMLTKWIAQLRDELQSLFDDAARRKSVPEISKYFQLFPLIDQEEVGLNCYSKFICSIITDTSRTLINTATQGENSSKKGIYASISKSLFESVSMMLSQHSPLINKHYGESYPNAVVFVVNKIQAAIDSQIGLITDTFYDVNRMEKAMQDIKLHSFIELKRRLAEFPDDISLDVQDNDLVSIVEVGDLIHELSAILHHWSLYCKFIVVKYFKPNGSPEEGIKIPDLLVNSQFNKKIQSKYLPAFETLYTFYFRRSLEKALTIEELPALEPYLLAGKSSKSPEQAPVSSVIEDFTLVFNNVLRNVLESAQPATVKNFVTECFKVVQDDLLSGFIQKALRENLPKYNVTLSLISPANNNVNLVSSPSNSQAGTPVPETMGGFFKGASSAIGNVVGSGTAMVSGSHSGPVLNNPKLMNFIIYMNTVASGQEFFTQIINNVTKRNPTYLKNSFPFGIDEKKISNIIENELLEPYLNLSNSILKQNLLNLYNQSLKNKMVALVNDCLPEANESNYIIYSSNMLNDPTSILKFKQDWDLLIKPYRQTLHRSFVYEKLLRLLVVNIVSLIERKLMSVLKKFKINELGALKLDKDLSFIINEVCEDDYELREKFVRVTQIVLLVGMDNDEYELSSFKGADDDSEESGINWVLTPLQRKQIRRFRI